MPAIVNTDQARAWSGYEGLHWASHQDRWDNVNRGANDYLFGAAAIGERDQVLDIGCGNGLTSRLAAGRAARGRVFGLDLSQPMLERARASAVADGLSNVHFELGDAQVYPFVPSGFDVAISRFGIMFFADLIAAFTNIRRALRPGGRLAFVSMGDMRQSDLGAVFAAMLKHVPGATGMASNAGPFSLSDPARIRDVLAAAGFQDIRSTPIDLTMPFGSDVADAAEFLYTSGPIHALLDQANPQVARQARQALADALRPFEQPDGVPLHGSHWLVTAIG